MRDLRTVLRAALTQALNEDLVTRNVATSVRVPSSRTRRAQAWTSEEAQQFLESARADGDPLYAAYVLVLVLGLRKGEVLGLTWPDVDFRLGELSIGRQLQRVRRELLHRETKTAASDATLPMPDICTTGLRLREALQAQERAAAGEAWQETGVRVRQPLRGAS